MGQSDPTGVRAAIRTELRARRAELDPDDQAAATMAVFTRLARLSVFRRARIASGYRAIRGELDIGAPMQFLAEQGVTVTTPRVVGDHLEFVVTDESTPLTTGPFGIMEPASGRTIAVTEHDVMLMPLVAFDRRGQRLGQGGGYYDRALAGLVGSAPDQRPKLVGIGHSFQELESVPTEPWDVLLDLVVTEDEVIEITPGTAAPPS